MILLIHYVVNLRDLFLSYCFPYNKIFVINRNNRIAPFEESVAHNKLNIRKELKEMSQMVLNNLTKPQSVYDYLSILESLSLSLLCSSKQKQRVYSYCMAICSNKDQYLPCIYEAAELTKAFFESPLTLRWSNFVDKNIEIQSSPSDRKRNERDKQKDRCRL